MKKFITKYLRPFVFQTDKEHINPPYVYGVLLMVMLVSMVIVFIQMAINRYDAGILGVTAGVIGTLAGLYAVVLRLYDVAKKEKNGGSHGEGVGMDQE